MENKGGTPQAPAVQPTPETPQIINDFANGFVNDETLMIIGEPIIPKPAIEFRTEDEVFTKWEKEMDDKLYTTLHKAGLILEDKWNKRA